MSRLGPEMIERTRVVPRLLQKERPARRPESRLVRVVGIIVVALVAGAGILGYVIGKHNHSSALSAEPGVVISTPCGSASSSPCGIAVLGAHQSLNYPNGFQYVIPPDVGWLEANGTISRDPPCLRNFHTVRVSKIEAVLYPIGGATEGTVVWIQC